jgi:hypothetical protein
MENTGGRNFATAHLCSRELSSLVCVIAAYVCVVIDKSPHCSAAQLVPVGVMHIYEETQADNDNSGNFPGSEKEREIVVCGVCDLICV